MGASDSVRAAVGGRMGQDCGGPTDTRTGGRSARSGAEVRSAGCPRAPPARLDPLLTPARAE